MHSKMTILQIGDKRSAACRRPRLPDGDLNRDVLIHLNARPNRRDLPAKSRSSYYPPL
jgi:hypothetical protein